MLVSRQSERALVDLGDLPKSCFEITSRFVLYTSILNEEGIMMLSIFASVPPKVINVAIKGERSIWTKRISKEFLNFSFVNIKS